MSKKASKSRSVLVTVGTTKFDDLIRAIDKQEFIAALKEKGYTHLEVQQGNGEYIPTIVEPKCEVQGIEIECYNYQPALAQSIAAAELVISHAGSGSIFEGLSAGRPMIVVPNERLMHNHQVELAEQLEKVQHLVYATPATLTEVLLKFDPTKLVPYKKGDAKNIAAYITSAITAA